MSKATLRIDGYIGQSQGLDALFGAEGFSLKSLNQFIDGLDSDVTDIHIEINSGGGSVTEGFAIHDKLVASGYTIHTEVLGLCGSIATIIALSAPVENRTMHANSEYFIHNPYWQPMGPDAMEADDLQRLADDLRNAQDKIIGFYAKKTGIGRDEVEKYMGSSKSFSAEQAQELGFVGKVISETVASKKYKLVAFVEPQKSQKTTKMDNSVKNLFEKINAKLESLLTKNIVNATYVLEDGSVFVEIPDDQELVGTEVDYEDGEYVLDDGSVVTVADGVVAEHTEVEEDEDMVDRAEYDALKDENDGLQNALDVANEEIATLKSNEETITAELESLKADIETFKSMVVTEETKATKKQNFKGEGFENLSPMEKWLKTKNQKSE